MTDDELDALLARQADEIRRAPLAAHRQAYVDATKALRTERDLLKAVNERLRDNEETFAARQHAHDRDRHEQHNADIGRLTGHYEARLDAQAVEHDRKYEQLMEMYKEAADSVSRAESQMADLDEIRRGEHEAYEELHSEVIQLRTLVQALRFDTDERDRLESALAQSHRDYLNIADALLPASSGPQDLIDRAHKLRSTLAEVALERDQAISERDAARWADDTRKKACEVIIAERDELQARAARLAQQHSIAMNMAERLTADLNAQTARCRLEAADRLDTERALTSERDAYRSALCDLLSSRHAYPADHPAMDRLWDRARDLLKNGPAKP